MPDWVFAGVALGVFATTGTLLTLVGMIMMINNLGPWQVDELTRRLLLWVGLVVMSSGVVMLGETVSIVPRLFA
jgi:hypothetical protein